MSVGRSRGFESLPRRSDVGTRRHRDRQHLDHACEGRGLRLGYDPAPRVELGAGACSPEADLIGLRRLRSP